MMEKGIITFKHFSPWTFSHFFLQNFWQPAAACKSDAIFRYVLLTRLYGCVAEETCKPAESLPVFRDHDMKNVKTFFSGTSCFDF